MLSSILDLNNALQDSLQHACPDGGVEGSRVIEVRLSHLAAGNAANDSYVGIELQVTDASGITVYPGSGTLVNNALDAKFIQTVLLDANLPMPYANCVGGVCQPGSLAMRIRDFQMHLQMDASHTAIQPSASRFGGFFFYYDSGFAYDNGVPSANSQGMRQALMDYTTMTNFDPNLTSRLTTAFESAQDLHMEAAGTLSPCTSPTNSVSNTNRTSVSLALLVDSL